MTKQTMTITNAANGAAIRVREAKVGIGEDVLTGLTAYVKTNELWNGWEIPYFTREQADAILEQAQAATDFVARYDANEDSYVFEGEDTFAPADMFVGEEWTLPSGEVVKLYCIGGYMWTWELEEGDSIQEGK